MPGQGLGDAAPTNSSHDAEPIVGPSSRPAPPRLSDTELADRIRAVARPSAETAELFTDGTVRLRTWHADDGPAIVAGLRDGSAAYWIVGMPHPYGPAEAADFLARADRELASAAYAHLAVTDVSSGRVLGAVGLHFHHDRQSGEIGYWTSPAQRRHGVARRAVALVTRWAFEELLLPRLELIIHPLNVESQVIASRSGFRREGLLRSYLEHRGLRNDYFCFSRLPDDPVPHPHPTLRVPLRDECFDAMEDVTDVREDTAEVRAAEATSRTGSQRGEIILRPWRLRDAESALAMIHDPEIRRWCIGIPAQLDLEMERQFIAEAARAWFEEGLPRFAITTSEDDRQDVGRLIGSIGFGPSPRPGVGQLGYLVSKQARGRGVAAAALSAITRWAFQEAGLTACELLIDPANVASVRLAERGGYARVDNILVRQSTPAGEAVCAVWRRTAAS